MSFAYKLLTKDEWADFEQDGHFPGSPADLADGFIHLSYAEQLPTTAAKHFSGRGELVLAAFDAGVLGPALKDEVSRGGALFPHLYRPLMRDEVLWHTDVPTGADGAPILPDLPAS